MARRSRGFVAYPLELEHVWNWFCALSGTRTSNGFGLNAIGFGEIAAWAGLSGAQPTPWEVSVLRRINAAVLPIINAKPGDREQEPDTEAAADDIAGVRSVMSILKARSKAVFGKKPANGP